MKLKLYQIDAFTDKLFAGNPAAVVPLKKWLPDELMQKLAMENNLAETAFFTPSKNKKYRLVLSGCLILNVFLYQAYPCLLPCRNLL